MNFLKKVMDGRKIEWIFMRAVATRFSIIFNIVMSWSKNMTPTAIKRSHHRIYPNVLLKDVQTLP